MGKTIRDITIRSYAYDETFTRGDKTVLSVLVHQDNNDYPFYRKLLKDKEKYRQFKEYVAMAVKDRIIDRLPELEDSIETLDVATPYTFKRYVNTTNGVYMSFNFTHRSPMYNHTGKVKGINNFYLSGQWMQGPGGLPIAMTQGKFAIQRICKRENLSFVFSPIPQKKKA